MTASETPDAPLSFRLAYVPGVMPGKWVRIWGERLPGVPLDLAQVAAAEAPGVLTAGDADAGLVRLPVDRDVLSAIPLYTETTVVVVPKDHLVTAADEVSLADLSDEVVFHPLDDVLGWERPPGRPAVERPATTADAIELVAAGVGVLVVPLSLARLHHRKDLTHRPVTDAPGSDVALSWPQDAHTDLVEEFIGIVRGRTVNSTRGRRQDAPEQRRGERDDARRKPAGGEKSTGQKSTAQRGTARKSAPQKKTGGQKGTGQKSGARRGRPGRRS
ncbi:LysR substrate-binding domain-containing protein [Streptomyces sp. CRN 30]|uniref:LysR substrate-binding domain-containing protein n=1 Tax=Streptomyces sp. CRN 30 TaxID=3075613 RepID=UPI002A81D9F7|nr:LysR substrate-binding domain-containing protein [Streptomyces sp. CRN 30]